MKKVLSLCIVTMSLLSSHAVSAQDKKRDRNIQRRDQSSTQRTQRTQRVQRTQPTQTTQRTRVSSRARNTSRTDCTYTNSCPSTRRDRTYQQDRQRNTTTRRNVNNDRQRRAQQNTQRRYDNTNRDRTHTRVNTQNRTRVYRDYRHSPYTDYVRHNRRWYNSRDYYSNVGRSYVYLNRWIRVSYAYNDGYYFYDGYPYFIYNGYRHRYSNYDNCDYQLVDSYTNSVERDYRAYTCSTGYDLCADLRDNMNSYERSNRYFCAERADYRDDYYY